MTPPRKEDDKNESIKKDLGRDFFTPFARGKEVIIWLEMMVGDSFSDF